MATKVWSRAINKQADNIDQVGAVTFDNTKYPSQVANVIDGAQLGMGVQITRLDAATPLVFNPAVLVVTQTPSMWDNFPYAQKMLKSLVEQHAKSVSGIDVSYTLETATTPVGWDGQELKVPTRATRAAVDPSFTWQELTGNLVWNFIRKWIFDIQHPDTNASLMSAVIGDNSTGSTNGASSNIIKPWLMSSFSMSMLAIQFDPTMRPENVIDGFYYTCMFPTATGDFGLERTHGTTKAMERSVPFTGLVQHNDNTKWLAQEVATLLQFHKVNYNKAIAGPGISVQTIKSNFPNESSNGDGVEKEINRIKKYFIAKQLLDPEISS